MSKELLIEAMSEYESTENTDSALMAFVEKWNPVIGREGGVVTEALARVTEMRNKVEVDSE